MSKFYIDIKTSFLIEDEEDALEMTCPAQYFYAENEQRIEYDEYGDDESLVHTEITVWSEMVEIKRTGSISMHLCLQMGREWKHVYRAGGQLFDITCVPIQVDHNLGEHGGKMILQYTIELGGIVIKNSLDIVVRKVWNK